MQVRTHNRFSSNSFNIVIGSIKYNQAIEVLRIFEGRLTRLKDEHDRVRKAKAALDLEQHAEDDRLQPIEEEMQDLKSIPILSFITNVMCLP